MSSLVARLLIGVPVIVFMGLEQILHPNSCPGRPVKVDTVVDSTCTLLWGYVSGLVYVICGVSLIINKLARPRRQPGWGFFILLLIIFYLCAHRGCESFGHSECPELSRGHLIVKRNHSGPGRGPGMTDSSPA